MVVFVNDLEEAAQQKVLAEGAKVASDFVAKEYQVLYTKRYFNEILTRENR